MNTSQVEKKEKRIPLLTQPKGRNKHIMRIRERWSLKVHQLHRVWPSLKMSSRHTLKSLLFTAFRPPEAMQIWGFCLFEIHQTEISFHSGYLWWIYWSQKNKVLECGGEERQTVKTSVCFARRWQQGGWATVSQRPLHSVDVYHRYWGRFYERPWLFSPPFTKV